MGKKKKNLRKSNNHSKNIPLLNCISFKHSEAAALADS